MKNICDYCKEEISFRMGTSEHLLVCKGGGKTPKSNVTPKKSNVTANVTGQLSNVTATVVDNVTFNKEPTLDNVTSNVTSNVTNRKNQNKWESANKEKVRADAAARMKRWRAKEKR